MKEGGRLDRYFAKKDTLLAKTLRRISPKTGSEFRNSRTKRVEDVALALPIFIATLPVEKSLEIAIRLIEKGNPIYKQVRYSNKLNPDGTLQEMEIAKLRSMYPGSDTPEHFGQHNGFHDPHITPTGKITRRLDLDELPQLRQVLKGELSMVGIRSIAVQDFKHLQSALSRSDFELWFRAYSEGKPGILHTRAINEGKYRKSDNNSAQFTGDILYANHASLGLDLYYLWRFLFVKKKPFSERNKRSFA